MNQTNREYRRVREPMSKTRKRYFLRLVGRIFVLVISALLCIFRPEAFDVLESNHFFKKFSILHIMWIIWVIDMIFQLVPIKDAIPLGSQKLFAMRFQPIREKINYEALRKYVISTTKSAYKVFIIWVLLLAALGTLYYVGILNSMWLFMISVLFYVCDLICVLIWCPFRLIMKNRCCTTCRIFNWDHLMMLSPMLFIASAYSFSLVLMAFAVWVLWELCVMMYPERFWEQTNGALTCSACTDKLCTQYCQKLRPKKKDKKISENE